MSPRQAKAHAVSVGYVGPGLTEGRMEARVLASSMASMAQLVEDSTRLVYGTEAAVRVEIDGNFRGGSFYYEFVAIALGGLTPTHIKEILTWLGLLRSSGLSVIDILRWLKGRKPKVAPDPGNSNRVRITAGKQSKVVNIQIGQLITNGTIRSGFEAVTQPLEEAGIDEMRVGATGSRTAEVIDKESRSAFLAPAQYASTLHDNKTTAVLQLISPNYKIGNKWQFAFPGEPPFYAPIQDEMFLGKLQRREVGFFYGDLVRVELRTTLKRTEAGTLVTSREVVTVLEVIPPAGQGDLFTEDSA